METSNIIALVLGGIGFIISIIGLILAPFLNLRSKRLEKRLEFRFALFQKILELWEHTYKKESIQADKLPLLMLEINKLVQLYGYNSEIISFRELVEYYNYYASHHDESNRQRLIDKFNDFFSISFNTFRDEIVLEKLPDLNKLDK